MGVFAVVAGGLWLARKPIAEGLGQSYCEGAGLECELNFSRLDFSGLTLVGLDVRGEGADEAVVRAGELAVDLAWQFPLRFTAQEIDASRIRPLALAHRWAVPERDVTELCLAATIAGLLGR